MSTQPVLTVEELVDRFLAWPLPKSVSSDPCASIPDYPNRTGTNLLTAGEARQLIEYLFATPQTEPDPWQDLRDAGGIFPETDYAEHHRKIEPSPSEEEERKRGRIPERGTDARDDYYYGLGLQAGAAAESHGEETSFTKIIEDATREPSPSGSETGWVIERGNSDPSEPKYWAAGHSDADRMIAWTSNHMAAIRFSRREDAEAVWKRLFPDIQVRICDHAWGAPPSPSVEAREDETCPICKMPAGECDQSQHGGVMLAASEGAVDVEKIVRGLKANAIHRDREGMPYEKSVEWKAADALTKLAQERDALSHDLNLVQNAATETEIRLKAERDSMSAQVQTLRKVLKPFAESPYATTEAPDRYGICHGVTVGDLRRARAALGEA